ncbi:NADH:ubiquinone oxidoreductase [Cladophialophora chaetospira]|uniref:NADH:ubiquinone oxidoreductase n=1 Tax=Cladophialophora chaetospira TaxID=386627 RepID=A0AA39CMV6_9EURO|nr:NADH:ubiquinone oxidoreductase [Cladophialophora chaetospira]
MALVNGLPSSPSPPGPGTSTEEALKYYKAQYELLESELADFQTSSKELEAELERDVEATEKRERQWKDKASNLQYEIDEWKTKYKQSKTEASSAQNALQKETTQLRETNRELTLRLRDIEVANDDYERKQRNTESSLEDLEQKYNQTIERGVLLEEEMRSSEQEREATRIEAQRLRDELSDLKIEADIQKEKLQKAIEQLARREKHLTIHPIAISASPRSESSPTTTTASSPTFDTPPAKSSLSDTPTPPSPPFSDKSTKISKPFATPGIPKSRQSLAANGINSRPSTSGSTTSRAPAHARGPSIPALSRTAPSSSVRTSLPRLASGQHRPSGLPQSASIVHLKNMQSKLAVLTERAHAVKSKLPAPVRTPPRASPRSGSALGNHIPASVTMRSRKRTNGSTVSGNESLVDRTKETPSVPNNRLNRMSLNQVPPSPTRSEASVPRHKTSRPSLNQQPPSPKRGEMAAPPPRPVSRGLASSRSSYAPSHSRPGSRASISGFSRGALGNGIGSNLPPNASTDRVRPQSSLSSYGGLDGAMDEGNENDAAITPVPRRATFARSRGSDVGTSIPSPSKRVSIGGASKLPARQSIGLNGQDSAIGLGNVREGYDLNETF